MTQHSVAWLLLSILSLASLASASERPNVLFIITDDQGYGDLSCHGNPILKTPNLDALHAESVRFTDFHVSPTCTPTRGALMSGHYSNRAGTWHTIMGRSILFEGETTLGQEFSDEGYATGMFGKWHMGDNYPYRPEDRGFDTVVRHGGGGIGQTPDLWNNAYFNDSYFCNGKVEKREGFCTDVFFAETKKFIESAVAEDKPFFAYLSTNAPHGPMHCPEKYFAPYKEQLGEKQEKQYVFFGMIANIDENVGKLREWLAEEGLAENTILVFMTDNGTVAGSKIHNAGMRGNKGNNLEGGHRVPFFVHWPAGGIDQPADVDQLTAHVDVLPTLQELCDLPVKEGYHLDGTSLVPLIKDPNADWPKRLLVTDSQRVLDPVKWKNCSIMSQKWRLLNGKHLYDITTDPSQRNNVAEKYPEKVEELRAGYDAWWESLKPAFAKHAEFVLGNPAENPSRLTCHDWLTDDGGHSPWNQETVREGQETNGDWAVRVEKAGRYRITLRRWPMEAARPLTASLPAGDPVPGMTAFREAPGKALEITAASVKIGDYEEVKPTEAGAESVTFETELPEGSARLKCSFDLASGTTIGAYYVNVERLKE